MVEFIQSQDLDTVIRLSGVRKIEIEGYREGTLVEQIKSMFDCKPIKYKSYDIVAYMDDDDEVKSYIMASYVQKSDAQKAVSKLFSSCDGGLISKMFQSIFYRFPDDKIVSMVSDTHGDDIRDEECKQS